MKKDSEPDCSDCNDCGIVMRACGEGERSTVVMVGSERRVYRTLGISGPRMRIELCSCVRRLLGECRRTKVELNPRADDDPSIRERWGGHGGGPRERET